MCDHVKSVTGRRTRGRRRERETREVPSLNHDEVISLLIRNWRQVSLAVATNTVQVEHDPAFVLGWCANRALRIRY